MRRPGAVLDQARGSDQLRELAGWLNPVAASPAAPRATVAALEGEGFSLTPLAFRPTAENLGRHLFDRLAAAGLPVAQVEVDETTHNRAFYRPS